jgi:pimeloyl-ACP methyl ester carboxylesterase
MNIREPKDRCLEINGLRLHYLEWGNSDRQPMLLLHGYMGHAHVWDELALSFRDRYHILALDQRGHGESQWVEESSYTIEEHFADITASVETLHLNELILLGHSMGGRNAMFYTALSPQKVDRLILVDARPGKNPDAVQSLRELHTHLPIQVSSLDEVVEAMGTLFPRLAKETRYNLAKHGYVQTDDKIFVPKYDTRMSVCSERTGYDAEDLWPLMKGIPCSTLIVRGEESTFLSREDAQRLCEIMPNAEWKEIPEAGHMPVQENPDFFIQVLSDFLHK